MSDICGRGGVTRATWGSSCRVWVGATEPVRGTALKSTTIVLLPFVCLFASLGGFEIQFFLHYWCLGSFLPCFSIAFLSLLFTLFLHFSLPFFNLALASCHEGWICQVDLQSQPWYSRLRKSIRNVSLGIFKFADSKNTQLVFT